MAAGLMAAACAELAACSSSKSTPTVDAAWDGGAPGNDAFAVQNPCGTEDVSLRDKNAAELFAASKIPVFDLYLPAADWEALKVHARDEEYVAAQACFEGKAVGVVGMRFKGSYGSLFNCFDDSGKNTCRKLSMKLKFDEYVDHQLFFGLKRLNFQAYHFDASYLKERLSYDLYRAMDVIAPRAAWAVLRVNGESQGLFGMVEQIDGRFTKDRWPANGDGNLLKERWPGGGDDQWLLAGLETNQDIGDISAFKAFSTAITAAPDADLRATLARFTDPDYFARYMAVDDAIANFDGITTYYTTGTPDEAGNHNFFFYEESASRFTIVPWDLESTLSLMSKFGNVPPWQTTPADCSATYLAWGGPMYVIAPGCDRVFRAISADLTSYRAAAARLLAGPFAEATMLSTIDTFAAFIRPEATADPHGPGVQDFENAVAGLRKEIPNLRLRLENLASGKPIVPLELGVGAVNDFEQADEDGVNVGTSCYTNANSTPMVTINATDPIDGAKSLRLGFSFGDETAGWQQWMAYSVPFASAPKDLTGLTGIRMKLRADEPRVLRVDIDSPKNSGAGKGIEVGWEVSVDTTAKSVSFSFAKAKVPTWADDPRDSLTAILQSATGLTFHPKCNTDASGHLPTGVTDDGWVDVDDLEFF